MTPRSAAVIGYGRFGELWARLLSPHVNVCVIEPDAGRSAAAREAGYPTPEPADGLSSDAIFYCVPISSFEKVLLEHIPHLRPGRCIFDCLSVKMHPKRVLSSAGLDGVELGLLHPLFGPDSVRVHGVKGLPITIDRFTLSDRSLSFWSALFERIGLEVHPVSAEEHDRRAAYSQGLTHYIGRILGELGIAPDNLDTVGAKKLHEIKDQVCNDSEELFFNLQQYNPFTLEMRIALGAAQSKIYSRLLPNRLDSKILRVGIQGGPGSFNEEAAAFYLERLGESRSSIEYLYTSEAVLRGLYEGQVDRGVFAIHNSLGGIVDESVRAMSKYTFSIVDEFCIPISHCLLTLPGVNFEDITTIMGHSQALKQCAGTLASRFPRLVLVSGEDALADPSKVAEELSAGNIKGTTAVLGSRRLADVYGLKSVFENLQDLDENLTSFLWVERADGA